MPLSLPILHTDKSFLNLRAIIRRHCLSLWFPSELFVPRQYMILSNCWRGKRKKVLRAWGDVHWAESRWEWQGAHQWPLWNMILYWFLPTHMLLPPFLSLSSPFSAQSDKILHFLTCHFMPLPTPFWLAQHLSTHFLPGDHLGPLSLRDVCFSPHLICPVSNILSLLSLRLFCLPPRSVLHLFTLP